MGNYVEDLYPYTNFITVRLSIFAPSLKCENAHQVTRLVFWFFLLPIAKTMHRF